MVVVFKWGMFLALRNTTLCFVPSDVSEGSVACILGWLKWFWCDASSSTSLFRHPLSWRFRQYFPPKCRKKQRKTLHGANPQNTTLICDLTSNFTVKKNFYLMFGLAKIRNGHLKIRLRADCKHIQKLHMCVWFCVSVTRGYRMTSVSEYGALATKRSTKRKAWPSATLYVNVQDPRFIWQFFVTLRRYSAASVGGSLSKLR